MLGIYYGAPFQFALNPVWRFLRAVGAKELVSSLCPDAFAQTASNLLSQVITGAAPATAVFFNSNRLVIGAPLPFFPKRTSEGADAPRVFAANSPPQEACPPQASLV